ncbi:MAG TPA: hypothetical protein VFP31_02750 [Gaiellaceae bacterium]|nr:hypothetical protein [Gaiellaceae bacterium]
MRLLLCGAVLIAALAAASGAATKEGAQAHLTSELPLGADAGATIRVSWRVDVPDESGVRRPFNAIGMFVRLLSRTGAPASTGFASGGAHADGRYVAEAQVPAGGIGGIRAGLRGTTDIFFPVVGDPFARCDAAVVRTALRSFVRAFNAGATRRLDRLFSRTNFVWYSSAAPGARTLSGAAGRASLAPYFRARHRRHDVLALQTFRFNGYDEARRLGHFELTAKRRADDYRGGTPFTLTGKGALDCSRPAATFAVLTLGSPG